MIARRALLGTALATPLAAPALAQGVAFARPVRLVVPFAPGGTSDLLARLMAPGLGERLGQSVVVENRSGANGHIGADAVAKAARDGHALLLTDAASLATGPALMPNLSYSPTRDLAPVSLVAFAPYIVAVNPRLPAGSVEELAALGRTRRLNLAHSGVGSGPHLTGLVLARHLGFSWELVPYRGGAPAVQAVVTGECDAVLNGATATQPFVTAGQLRALAVTGTEPLRALPDAPTAERLGWPEIVVQAGTWQALLTTGATPAPVVDALHAAAAATLADPALAARIGDVGGTVRTMDPVRLGRWLDANTESWGRVVRENDVRLE